MRPARLLLPGLGAGAVAVTAWLVWPPVPVTTPLNGAPATAMAAGAAVPAPIHNPRADLETLEIGGAPAVVLLHGYGSDPEAWFPFVETMVVPGRGRLIFPRASEPTTPPDGPLGGRAWWKLELHTFRAAGGEVDMSRAQPPGLQDSAARVQRLLGEIEGRLGQPPGSTILGGFSQGAMVAAQTAFTSEAPLRALVLLGGTLVNEAAWRAGMSARHALPVFIAHGRGDLVLPFAAAERLQAACKNAGLAVTWVPFEGGHELPPEVIAKLNVFFAGLPALPVPSPPPRLPISP